MQENGQHQPHITPALADRIGQEARAGRSPADLAASYGLSQWVVGLICTARPRAEPPASQRARQNETYAEPHPAMDPADLARVGRAARDGMAVADIARELAVSYSTAERLYHRALIDDLVAAGHSAAQAAKLLGLSRAALRRAMQAPRFGSRYQLRVGERFVTRPTRCPRCGASLRIVPCRLCRIRDLLAGGVKVWTDPKPTA